jgi:hypothetical protein
VRMRILAWLGVTVGVVAAACGHDAARRAVAGAVHVDSAVTRSQELRRFRADLTPPAGLIGGAASRDALVRRYVRALERADTAALQALVIDRAEFAYLYYPTTPQGRPPYDLSPGLMWFMLQENSRRGLVHAIEERGGRPLGFVGYSCDRRPSREGENTVVGPCLIRRRQPGGDEVQERLFGLIIERDHYFKLVSLANKL